MRDAMRRLRHYRREIVIDVILVPGLAVAGVFVMAVTGFADAKGHVPVLPGALDRVRALEVGAALTLIAAMLAAIRNVLKAPATAGMRALQQRIAGTYVALDELSALELAEMFDHFGFSTSERISLFIPTADGGAFQLVARHALSPQYKAKGREVYSMHEGCLGRAWTNVEAVADDLPDPTRDTAAWQTQLQKDWGIPPSVSAAIRMKTRTCIAFGITARRGAMRGVIVFESQQLAHARPRSAVFTIDTLRRELKDKYRDQLLRLLEIHERLGR